MEMRARNVCAWCKVDQGTTSLVDWMDDVPIPACGVVNDILCPSCAVQEMAAVTAVGIVPLEG